MKDEVLDGIVVGLERVGIEVKVGAVKAFIPHTKIPNSYKYDENQVAFIEDETPYQVIKKDCLVRFKVENVSIKGQEGAASLNVIGNISDDYLGILEK